MFFGVGGAVWVVDGNCTVFIDSGQNDEVTCVGKITWIHGTDQGDAGLQGGKDVFLCYRDVFCCEAQVIGTFGHQRPGGSFTRYVITLFF